MGRFVRGDVVVVPFPFSDLSSSKRRPALVLASPGGDDIILCQITSQASRDANAVALDVPDYTAGHLPRPSFIRPNRLFTADGHIVLYTAGHLTAAKMNQVTDAVIALFRA